MADNKGLHPADRIIKFLERRPFSIFPPYVWVTLAVMILIQFSIYFLTKFPVSLMTLHDLMTPFDRRIPFIPGWIIIYILSYLSWGISLIWIVAESKPHGYRFACSYILCLIISCVIFLAYPGTLERPEPEGSGFIMFLVRVIYWFDSPTNLCPSLHVLISYFCWRGTFGCRKIPVWYKVFNFVFLILVCFSILFVKQHVVLDIIVAIPVGELSLQICRLFRAERIFMAAEKRLNEKKECETDAGCEQ
ncbi:MAG: hypothetical protein IJM90_08805 [Firmicutes bacterium]|nr:hypothetical protein [Bacillota bacterium]